MRRHAITLIETIVILGTTAILAAILMPVFQHTHCNDRASSCRSQLRRLALACAQYRSDYDGRFPGVALHDGSSLPPYPQPYGWADAMYPYLGQLYLFQCPSESNDDHIIDARSHGFTDYWFNGRLSNLSPNLVPKPQDTLLFGEGGEEGQGSDARYALRSFPPSWLSSPASPLFRHYRGADFTFADGHVKWLVPTDISSDPARQSQFTFIP